MKTSLNRRDFLRLTGVVGAATIIGSQSRSVSAQDHGPHGGGGPHVPEYEEGYIFNDIHYPYVDEATGLTKYHETIRELPFQHPSRTPLTAPVNLLEHQPPRVVSENGVLELDLNIAFAYAVLNGQKINIRSYNGSFPAPTLVARPGDVLRLRQINNLPHEVPGPVHNINHPHGFNTINLHVHGLNVSPQGNEDNVLLEVHPGETFENEFHIPTDHPTGTFWYHPHKHGSAAHHLGNGMAGLLILVDEENDIRAVPEIGAAKEVELIFQEIYLQDLADGVGQSPDFPNSVDHWFFSDKVRTETTVNGVACNELQTDGSLIFPEIHMRPGEVQHWRMSHAGIFINHPVIIEGHEIHIIANDGITAEEVTTVDEMFWVSGQRRDVLIKASATPGTYAVKRRGGYQQAAEVNQWPEKTLFNIVVDGDPMDMALPTKLNPPSARLPYIQEEEIVRKRDVAFSFIDNTALGILLFTIDNKVVNPARVDFTMVLDTAEEWTIVNDRGSDHPFHFHVNWFELHSMVDHDGTLTVYDPPLWMDTANIPRDGQIVIRHRFQNYQGKAVFHCHIIAHEDEGMMSIIEFVTAEPKTQTITSAGGALMSPDYEGQVIAHFQPWAVAADTEVTYQYHSSPNQPTVQVAPAIPAEMGDFNRFFTLSASQGGVAITELDRAITLEVKYSKGQEDRHLALSAVGLYRYDEASASWTNEGISMAGRSDSLLTCITKKLGTFAVTGPTSVCADFDHPAGVGPEDLAYMMGRKDSPYPFFIKQADIFPADSPDGVIDANDIMEVVNAQGQYCPN
jgi:FtsP/CotA-like multicopper oxidase with cupredoxin domain